MTTWSESCRKFPRPSQYLYLRIIATWDITGPSPMTKSAHTLLLLTGQWLILLEKLVSVYLMYLREEF